MMGTSLGAQRLDGFDEQVARLGIDADHGFVKQQDGADRGSASRRSSGAASCRR